MSKFLLRLEEIGVHFNEENFKPEKLMNQLVVDWLLTTPWPNPNLSSLECSNF
jgi:hypothetical protein